MAIKLARMVFDVQATGFMFKGYATKINLSTRKYEYGMTWSWVLILLNPHKPSMARTCSEGDCRQYPCSSGSLLTGIVKNVTENKPTLSEKNVEIRWTFHIH